MREPRRVLVVEDDLTLALGLEMILGAEGYRVVVARDGLRGLAAAREGADLVVLDLMLPGLDGYTVVQRLRAADDETPVLMLTARAELADRVKGLRLGADDYLTKPFSAEELLARVHALLRRSDLRHAQRRRVRFGSVEVDLEARAVWRDGDALELTAREFDLLAHLIATRGRVQSREQLLRSVWGETYAGTLRTVDNFVHSLRVKLEEDPARCRYLLTVRGAGYRFAPIE